MAQKTNPNVFRLGKTKTWSSQYFEKKPTEIAIYSFKNSEIKKFIYKFFKDNGLIINNCNVHYSDENSLYINVSYYLTFNSTAAIKLMNKKQNIKTIGGKPQGKSFYNDIKPKPYEKNKKIYFILRQHTQNYKNYKDINYFHNLPSILRKRSYLKAYKAIELEQSSVRVRRLLFLKAYKKYLTSKNFNNAKTIETNKFLSKFFESLHLFVNKKINIFLTVQQLNKNLRQNFTFKKAELLKKKLIRLKKYEQNNFFKEGVNILSACLTHKNSASLLAQFLATQLQKIRRHNYFLKFVKAALKLFNSKTLSNIKGIKIKIKGRFNGAPRAKRRKINIGKGVSNLRISADIDYSAETSYTANGTFGVKVWTFKK